MNETLIKKMKNNKSTKIIIIVILCLWLNIPLSMVSSQVESRQQSESQALESVKKSWGDIIDVNSPYVKMSDVKYYPDTSVTNVQINVQQKKRGYFNVPVYSVTLQMKIKFNKPVIGKNKNSIGIKQKNEEDDSLLIMPFKRSNSMTSFKITEVGKDIELEKNVYSDDIIAQAGLISDKSFFGKELMIEMEIRGVDQFNLNSFSKAEKVNIKSNWKNSKFEGDTLPTNSVVTDSGIDAHWSLSKLGASAENTVSVRLLWNNPDYAKIDRIMSYGFLFISLIFITFFILEYVYKSKLHPIQYGAVGIAISVFYLLLLALLEKIGFDAAYIISSMAIISLNTFYMAGTFAKTKGVFFIFLVEALLHIYFYIILSLENIAFLVGSIGVFIALATVMIITRKFDWYEATVLKADKND